MNKPNYLPDYPEAPEGYHFKYRGKGWKPKKEVLYIACGSCNWDRAASYAEPVGFSDMHYAEAVKDTESDKFNELQRQYKEAQKLIGKKVTQKDDMYDSFVVENVIIVLDSMINKRLSAFTSSYFARNGFCVSVEGEGNALPYPETKIHEEKVKVNGYEAEDCGEYYKFGCAKIDKYTLIRAKDYLQAESVRYNTVGNQYTNRCAKSVKIGDGEFTLDILNKLV